VAGSSREAPFAEAAEPVGITLQGDTHEGPARAGVGRGMAIGSQPRGARSPSRPPARTSYGRFLDPLVPLIEDGAIRPVIDATFPFDRAGDAHRRITERKNIGKVVLVASGR
jgi:NADPH:quinone reductase-like Zn-dependent oxidoreductase